MNKPHEFIPGTTAERETACKVSHPGFTISCDKCGSKCVTVESSIGYSRETGQWGSVELVCYDCNERASIYGD